jgi:uncharacterized membrane protein YeaQ/YmgE (transglycosylase-associated protein family)
VDIIISLVIGAVAGWLAGQIMKGSGYGLIGDIIVGLIGGVIGGWLWPQLHLPMLVNDIVTRFVTSTVGAVLLLFVLRLIRR